MAEQQTWDLWGWFAAPIFDKNPPQSTPAQSGYPGGPTQFTPEVLQCITNEAITLRHRQNLGTSKFGSLESHGIPFPLHTLLEWIIEHNHDSPLPLAPTLPFTERPSSPSKPLPPPPYQHGPWCTSTTYWSAKWNGPTTTTATSPTLNTLITNPYQISWYIQQIEPWWLVAIPAAMSTNLQPLPSTVFFGWFFTISHMKKTALEWFEEGIMEPDPLYTPTWCSSWKDFVIKFCTNFSPVTPLEWWRLNSIIYPWIMILTLQSI